ncbi:MAG: Uma2 family endonuclease [Gammaproteobacteria bacterium]|nr:Uma2 family endonuclease [Gammaproteobacteria bacterium]MYF30492.1 Uma2 family endonuclease [Gammaproteobacteria bacterium]MYK47572.1 Uma2 family endonuclease [Gammaproteobacteria bacterium]
MTTMVSPLARLREIELWYVSAMRDATVPRSQVGDAGEQHPEVGSMRPTHQNTPSTGVRQGRAARRSPAEPLSVVHAAALYQPVPPVGCDDDGYPYEDSATVDNSDHNVVAGYIKYVVGDRYGDRDDVFVDADLGLYFEQGNRSALVAPDVLVALGVEGGSRNSYKIWEEGKPPDLVVEVLSDRTWRKDLRDKPDLYEALGIAEYWSFDQHRLSDDPPLLVRRLDNGSYRVEGDGLTGHSAILGLGIRVDGTLLRLHDPATGLDLPYYNEAVAMYRQAEGDAMAEAEAREAAENRAALAERRIAELEEQLRRSKEV